MLCSPQHPKNSFDSPYNMQKRIALPLIKSWLESAIKSSVSFILPVGLKGINLVISGVNSLQMSNLNSSEFVIAGDQ
jgi:hypothetical protein